MCIQHQGITQIILQEMRYESSEASAISETKENNPVSVSSGELIEGVNDNARQEEKPGFKFGRRVLFSGISEAARAAIIIVIAIAAISAYKTKKIILKEEEWRLL